MTDRIVSPEVAGSAEGQISERTISRMRWYLYALEEFARHGMTTIASREIADKVGVKSGLVRKDLCHFGGFGRPSVGYNIAYLQKKIREILRITEERRVAWVGSRRLMEDEAIIRRLADRNCIITAIFDPDPAVAGTKIGGIEVLSTDGMDRIARSLNIESAVIAASEEDAQQAVDKLVSGGVKAVLNLAPVVVTVPPGVVVRNIDLAGELMMLTFHGDSQTSA